MTAQQIYSLRQRHGLTQTAFARLVWTTRNTVQNWERSRAPVDAARFELAAIKLGDQAAMDQVEVAS